MRCYICDSALSPESTKFNNDHQDFDPCGHCLTIIGEVFTDPPEESEITLALEDEWGDYLKEDGDGGGGCAEQETS